MKHLMYLACFLGVSEFAMAAQAEQSSAENAPLKSAELTQLQGKIGSELTTELGTAKTVNTELMTLVTNATRLSKQARKDLETLHGFDYGKNNQAITDHYNRLNDNDGIIAFLTQFQQAIAASEAKPEDLLTLQKFVKKMKTILPEIKATQAFIKFIHSQKPDLTNFPQKCKNTKNKGVGNLELYEKIEGFIGKAQGSATSYSFYTAEHTDGLPISPQVGRLGYGTEYSLGLTPQNMRETAILEKATNTVVCLDTPVVVPGGENK